MTELKWTPGPWAVGKVTLQSEIYRYEVLGQQGYSLVATTYGTTTGMADWYAGARHVKANSHLIAAAPELYEALEMLRGQYVLFVGPDDDIATFVLDQVDAALAKARGEK